MKRVNLLEKNKRAGKLLKQARSSPPLPKESSLVSPLQRTNHNFFTHGYERHGASPRRQLLRVVTRKLRKRAAWAIVGKEIAWLLGIKMIPRPSEREKERRGKREGKLLRRLWTGRCSNFKGPIPIFNLLRGQERRRGGSKPTPVPTLGSGSLPVPALVPRYSPRRILFLGPLPFLPNFATSLREKPISLPRNIYTRYHPGQTNSSNRERERGEREGVFIDRNIVPRRYEPNGGLEEKGEHSELIPSFA